MDVFLGGAGEGRTSSRMCVAEKFSQHERAPNSPVCVIYYMWSSGGFTDNPSTCSHSDDTGGTTVFVPSRSPRSSGYDFLCTCGLCYYMLYVYYMLYACYMSSSEPSCANVIHPNRCMSTSIWDMSTSIWDTWIMTIQIFLQVV